MLVAGHKKDVVITKEVLAPHNSHKVSFHGFYDDQGFPHEPCHESRWVDAQRRPLPNCPKDGTSLAHPAQVNGYMFSDYSQGVRLVHPVMEVAGVEKCVAKVLADPEEAYLISSEGPFAPARIPKPAIKLGG
jgi:hypothetical protein